MFSSRLIYLVDVCARCPMYTCKSRLEHMSLAPSVSQGGVVRYGVLITKIFYFTRDLRVRRRARGGICLGSCAAHTVYMQFGVLSRVLTDDVKLNDKHTASGNNN